MGRYIGKRKLGKSTIREDLSMLIIGILGVLYIVSILIYKILT